MLAAVFAGAGRLEVRDVPEPRLARDEDVLLRVRAAGICGSDLHILSVPPGHPATVGTILGHEYAAEVVDAGPAATEFRPGDRVVVDPNLTCGRCLYCRMGRPNSCLDMTTLGVFIDGGMARYNIAPARALHRISREVPVEEAVLAEPLSCVLNGMRQLSPQVGESCLVLGAGPIGLLFVAMLTAAGVRPILVAEVVPYRAQVAREVGADEVFDPRGRDVAADVLRLSDIGVDMAVDTVGTQVIPALRSVRRGGRVLLFGVNTEAESTLRQYEVTRDEKRIVGSFIARYTFPAAIRVLESGRIDGGRFITHRVGLRDVHAGLETLRRGEGIKVVVTPE